MKQRVEHVIAEQASRTFVGRGDEIRLLLKAIEDSGPTVFYVHGIAGIGKSRLLAAFAEQARSQGTRTITLDCRAVEPTEQGFLRALALALRTKIASAQNGQDVLTTAIEMHQGGRLTQAAGLYQKILAQEKENAVAMHLLGVLHHQQGDHAKAIELIGRAVAMRPNVPAFHANLAEAYRATGQLDRAAGCCRAALGLWPDYPEALCNLGLALQGLGKKTDAVVQFRRALELRPEFPTAHNNLGIVLRELGQFDEALEHFRRAVELDPNFAPARTNLGQMLLDRGQAEEALPHCEEAVRLQPNMAALHHNLGNALRAWSASSRPAPRTWKPCGWSPTWRRPRPTSA